VILIFAIVGHDPPIVLLAIFGGYAAWSPIVWVWRRLRRLRRGERTSAGKETAE